MPGIKAGVWASGFGDGSHNRVWGSQWGLGGYLGSRWVSGRRRGGGLGTGALVRGSQWGLGVSAALRARDSGEGRTGILGGGGLLCCSFPVPLSRADTFTMPFASMSKVTSTCGTPRGAGGIPIYKQRRTARCDDNLILVHILVHSRLFRNNCR